MIQKRNMIRLAISLKKPYNRIMSKEYQHILERAMSLPQNEFFALVQALLSNVQDRISQETDLSPLDWEDQTLLAELDRRAEEVRMGKIKPIPGEEVMEKLRKRFR